MTWAPVLSTVVGGEEGGDGDDGRHDDAVSASSDLAGMGSDRRRGGVQPWVAPRRRLAERRLLSGQPRRQRPGSPDRPVPVGDAHRPSHRGNADHRLRAVRARPRPRGAWRHPSSVSTTSPTPSSGSTAAQPTRAAPPRPPPAPGTALCTSRSVCSAPLPWSRPHSFSPPGCVRRMAGVTWPGRRSSLARCCSSSCSATRRSNERRAVATCNGRRSCWCRWASRCLRSVSVPWRGHATSCSSADTGGLAIRAGPGVTRDHPRWNGASGTPPAWRWMGGHRIRP